MESEVRSQKSEVRSQKSTPSLDFIATPEPNSQQEFLTYPNSIESKVPQGHNINSQRESGICALFQKHFRAAKVNAVIGYARSCRKHPWKGALLDKVDES